MLKILALDLGTKTGVARNYGPSPLEATWNLATATEVTAWGKQRLTRRCDPRISRLFERLSVWSMAEPDLVIFEDVEFSTYTKQTQLWASFRTAVWLAFDGRAVIECVPVTTLKKFATGSGAADKVAMRRALFTQFPYIYSGGLDDNAVDAVWILKWAEKNLSRTIIP